MIVLSTKAYCCQAMTYFLPLVSQWWLKLSLLQLFYMAGGEGINKYKACAQIGQNPRRHVVFIEIQPNADNKYLP
jgi:hypothetical protein